MKRWHSLAIRAFGFVVLALLPAAVHADAQPAAQAAWEVTVAQKLEDAKIRIRHSDEIITVAVAPAIVANTDISKFEPGDTIWIHVSADHTAVTQVDCAYVNAKDRVVTMVSIALALLFFTAFLIWGGARALLMGADGYYSKSKFQMVVWFAVLVVTYISTYILRWRYAGMLGGIGIPAHLALISGFSAFSFAAAKGIAVAQNTAQAATPGAGAGAAAPPARQYRGASHWKFIRDLLTDEKGNPDIGDYQMLVIVLVAVVTYLYQAYHFAGTIRFATNVDLPDVDTTILAAFGLGQGAYLGKKVASQGQPEA